MAEVNPYARSARLEKATTLVNAIVSLDAVAAEADGREVDLELLAEALATWTPDNRVALAKRAGVNAPSQETWDLVLELLRDQAVARRGGVRGHGAPRRTHPLGPGPCDWACGRPGTITLRASDGRWYRSCGWCYATLGTTATASLARTIQGG